MAKKKKLDDLESELAELEAELAALEGKAASAAPAKPKAAPAPEPEPAPAEEEDAPKKRRFGLPKLKKGAAAEAPPAAEVAEAGEAKPAKAEPKPEAPKTPPAELPRGDLTHWRRDGDTWVRAIPEHSGPIVRRVLDEDDQVVREEPATQEDLDEVTGVKAERGVGKLLSGAGSSLGGAAAKLRTIRFGRKGDKE